MSSMRAAVPLFFLVALCPILISPSARAEASPEASALGKNLAGLLVPDGPGESILIARAGKILFSQGYGLAAREANTPVAPETRFRIGSVTKQFTAAAILRLAEKGKLSIEDPLSKYFPAYPGGDKITLRNLLNHTSGLHSYTEGPDFAARVSHVIAPDDLIAWFQNAPADFPPGEQFRYCNTGYFLLGRIIAKVSGQSYGNYLQEQFFAPLEMSDTGLWLNASPPAKSAKGYNFDGKDLQPATEWDMSWAGGAGELYSTTSDLWRWTEALQGGRVLSLESLKTMTAEFTVAKPETLSLRYGMGLYRTEVEWLPAIGHNGGLPGYLSTLMWFPEQKMTMVILSNAMAPKPGTSPDEILPIAVRAFLKSDAALHAPAVDSSISAKNYASYAGRYQYPGGVQQVTVEDGRIYGQLGAQDRFELFPSGPDAFFYKAVAARIVFQRDAQTGKTSALTHTQNGMSFKAPRIADDAGTVSLTNDVLDAFIGQYEYGPSAILTVTRRENQLYAQLGGQPEFPIFPKSDHEFFWKAVPASIEFVREPDGRVGKAIHHQGGATLVAPRKS
jgi:CubicO group peptidase (beta-lactamase class C family)